MDKVTQEKMIKAITRKKHANGEKGINQMVLTKKKIEEIREQLQEIFCDIHWDTGIIAKTIEELEEMTIEKAGSLNDLQIMYVQSSLSDAICTLEEMING